MNIFIRPETSADHESIRHVNCLAFGQDDEAKLVDALRDGGYVRVSLIAEQAGQIVGHILFSDLPIITEAGTVPALALAPMAVLPAFQGRVSARRWCRRGWRRADSRTTGSSSWAMRTSTHGSDFRRNWLRTLSHRFRAATPSWRWSWCLGRWTVLWVGCRIRRRSEPGCDVPACH